MRIPQQPRSRALSPYANRAGRTLMPTTLSGRSHGPGSARGRVRRPAIGGASSTTLGKGGPRRRQPPIVGLPGWYPPDWRGGIVRAAPPPELGPGNGPPGPDGGGADDAVWQAPIPLNRVAPTTGPG